MTNTLRDRYKKIGSTSAGGSSSFVTEGTDFSAGINRVYIDAIADHIEQLVDAPIGSVIHVVNVNPNDKNIILYNDEWTSFRTLAGTSTSFATDRGIKVARNTEIKFVRISATQILILSGTAIRAWIPSRKPPAVDLNWMSNGDTNGVIYYLGTLGLTTSFANPHTVRNMVLCSTNMTPLDAPRTIDKIVDRGIDNLTQIFHGSQDYPAGYYLQIQLLDTALTVKRYTLQSSANHALSAFWNNWNFRVSNDGVSWTTLHSGTPAGVGISQFYNSGAISNTNSYSYFRWELTSTAYYGVMGEIELYGTLESI